mmetsp:Transcript_14561/g.60764  ORF Transcript_14561/g.60764 Transcript_14561/m.60764 type:complete len:219 (+) Transcript_14561:675-1331(+)
MRKTQMMAAVRMRLRVATSTSPWTQMRVNSPWPRCLLRWRIRTTRPCTLPHLLWPYSAIQTHSAPPQLLAVRSTRHCPSLQCPHHVLVASTCATWGSSLQRRSTTPSAFGATAPPKMKTSGHDASFSGRRRPASKPSPNASRSVPTLPPASSHSRTRGACLKRARWGISTRLRMAIAAAPTRLSSGQRYLTRRSEAKRARASAELCAGDKYHTRHCMY